jgi:hypothetical protein
LEPAKPYGRVCYVAQAIEAKGPEESRSGFGSRRGVVAGRRRVSLVRQRIH